MKIDFSKLLVLSLVVGVVVSVAPFGASDASAKKNASFCEKYPQVCEYVQKEKKRQTVSERKLKIETAEQMRKRHLDVKRMHRVIESRANTHRTPGYTSGYTPGYTSGYTPGYQSGR